MIYSVSENSMKIPVSDRFRWQDEEEPGVPHY